MQEPVVIDKGTYKVLKYLYRHKEIALSKIREKYGEDGMIAAMYLCPKQFAAYRDESGHLTFDISVTSTSGSIGLTPLGKKYVEDHVANFTKWIIPTLISVLALITSVAALIASMGNEITVHLIK